jgi:hypothetical protein
MIFFCQNSKFKPLKCPFYAKFSKKLIFLQKKKKIETIAFLATKFLRKKKKNFLPKKKKKPLYYLLVIIILHAFILFFLKKLNSKHQFYFFI